MSQHFSHMLNSNHTINVQTHRQRCYNLNMCMDRAPCTCFVRSFVRSLVSFKFVKRQLRTTQLFNVLNFAINSNINRLNLCLGSQMKRSAPFNQYSGRIHVILSIFQRKKCIANFMRMVHGNLSQIQFDAFRMRRKPCVYNCTYSINVNGGK